MIPEKEREALMRLTMCARIECDICIYKGDSIEKCDERITKNMNILADALRADRKTEPQTETKTETQNSNLAFEKDECAKEYEELGLKELKELIKADRKTESNSEKPNNCEDLQDWKDRMWAEAIVTEPTISKMEQVEDEPQTDMAEDIVRSYGFKAESYQQAKAKDEPKTERSE